MSEEQLKAEIERLEEQQKVLQNDWHAHTADIANIKQIVNSIIDDLQANGMFQ